MPVTVHGDLTAGRQDASDTVNIQVVRPARKEIVFEDVHFDFDRYSLRPEATRALDEAIKTLQENAELRIEIEGHTCNIGTAEYNLALGERRADRGARLPGRPRHRRRSPPHRELRRGAAEARQRPRRDAAAQPARRAASCGCSSYGRIAGTSWSPGPERGHHMRFVNVYLIGYFLLILGALAALWYGGVLRHISAMWVMIGLVIAVGLGIMLAISAGKPEITRE